MFSIETNNLNKTYNGFVALKDLNLKIKKGEVYGFIGKNGAGKTTTINLILSLIHKDSGDISINGSNVVYKDQSYKKSIGFVPDVPVFPSYMNPQEYLSFTCDVFEMSKAEKAKAIERVLAFVELTEVKRKISGFSRGMKQRLAIAQALVHDPEIIIMDEPTSALDPIGRKEVMDIILRLKGKKTIFYSTHILDDVEKVCDRIGLLDNGVLLLEETIENIQNEFVSNKVFIETTSDASELFKKVKSLNLFANVEIKDKGIIIEPGKELNENSVLKEIMNLDETIHEFRRVRTSLEDIFIRLTSDNVTK